MLRFHLILEDGLPLCGFVTGHLLALWTLPWLDSLSVSGLLEGVGEGAWSGEQQPEDSRLGKQIRSWSFERS